MANGYFQVYYHGSGVIVNIWRNNRNVEDSNFGIYNHISFNSNRVIVDTFIREGRKAK